MDAYTPSIASMNPCPFSNILSLLTIPGVSMSRNPQADVRMVIAKQ